MEAPVGANELAARRIDELTSKIDKLNDKIEKFEGWIRDEKNKPVPDQESIKRWIVQIEEWRETIKSLRKALDVEIERERASLEKRLSNLSVDDPGLLYIVLCSWFLINSGFSDTDSAERSQQARVACC